MRRKYVIKYWKNELIIIEGILLSVMFIIIMASGVVDKLHLSLHDPIQAGQAGPPDHSIRFVRTHLLGVMWETEERWNSSISESDSLTRPVEVLLSEVLTAEPGRLTGSETFPSQGYFPLLPQHLIFGKPAGCGIYYLFYFIQAGNTPEGLKKNALVKSVLAMSGGTTIYKVTDKEVTNNKKSVHSNTEINQEKSTKYVRKPLNASNETSSLNFK